MQISSNLPPSLSPLGPRSTQKVLSPLPLLSPLPCESFEELVARLLFSHETEVSNLKTELERLRHIAEPWKGESFASRSPEPSPFELKTRENGKELDHIAGILQRLRNTPANPPSASDHASTSRSEERKGSPSKYATLSTQDTSNPQNLQPAAQTKPPPKNLQPEAQTKSARGRSPPPPVPGFVGIDEETDLADSSGSDDDSNTKKVPKPLSIATLPSIPSGAGPAELRDEEIGSLGVVPSPKPSLRKSFTADLANPRMQETQEIGGAKETMTKPKTLNMIARRYPTLGGRNSRAVSFCGEHLPEEAAEEEPASKVRFSLKRPWASITQVTGGQRGSLDVLGANVDSEDLEQSPTLTYLKRLTLTGDFAALPGSRVDKFVSEPNSFFNFEWDLVGAFLIIFDLIYIPLSAFGVEPNPALSWFSAIFWTMDIVRNCLVGYHDHGVLVRDFRLSLTRYLRTWFGVDITIVLIDWVVTIMVSTEIVDGGFKSLKLLRLIRLMKLIRLVKLLHSVRAIEDRIMSERAAIVLKILKQLLAIILMCHVIGCAWFAIGDSSSGWVSIYLPSDSNMAYQYSSSFHWALTQFTPASVGIQPTNVSERFFGIFTLLCALIMFSLFISGITTALQELRSLDNVKARSLWQLRRYMLQAHVPTDVSIRVQSFCNVAWDIRTRSIAEQDVCVLELLSTPLRSELRTAIFEPRLVQHAFFMLIAKTSPLTMQDICTLSTTRCQVAPGDMLFHEGQSAKHMFFLTKGIMVYSRAKFQNLEVTPFVRPPERLSNMSGLSVDTASDVTLSPGSWICETVLWVEWVHNGSLYSATECDLVLLESDAFFQAVQKNKNSLREGTAYAKGFLAGLNRTERATDLFMSDLLEGLWFRLLTEFHVSRRGTRRTSSIMNSVLETSVHVRDRIVQSCCKKSCRCLGSKSRPDDEHDDT